MEESKEELVFVIDFSWLYYRSRFAFSSLSFQIDKVKYATGTIYGVYDALFTIMECYGKDVRINLCLDGTPKKQLTLNNSYKSGREGNTGTMDLMEINRWDIAKQFTILPNVIITWSQNMEADDTIAFVVKTKKENEKMVVLSGDGDIRQLISTKNKIFCTQVYDRANGYTLEDEAYLWKFGIKGTTELRPDSIALYLAITGDSSDGINGISRFRTAAAKDIANEVKTLDGLKALIENSRTTPQYEKPLAILKENMSIVERNYKMISLDPLYIPKIFRKEDFPEGSVDLGWFDKYGCSKVYNDILSITTR